MLYSSFPFYFGINHKYIYSFGTPSHVIYIPHIPFRKQMKEKWNFEMQSLLLLGLKQGLPKQ